MTGNGIHQNAQGDTARSVPLLDDDFDRLPVAVPIRATVFRHQVISGP